MTRWSDLLRGRGANPADTRPTNAVSENTANAEKGGTPARVPPPFLNGAIVETATLTLAADRDGRVDVTLDFWPEVTPESPQATPLQQTAMHMLVEGLEHIGDRGRPS